MEKIIAPDFWTKTLAKSYTDWVSKKAAAHHARDKKRCIIDNTVSIAQYREAIHEAVLRSKGNDYYTNEKLDWYRIGEFNNGEAVNAKERGENYKALFHGLPTIDHAFFGQQIRFEICSWRTNDAKNDLNLNEFHSLCTKVLEHAGYQVTKPLSAPVAPHKNASTAQTP